VGRSRGTLRWSWDDGRTWPGELLLYRGSFAHSLLVMLDEKSVGVLAKLDGYKRIAFQRVALPGD
jgi:sialidase-1